MPKKPQPTKNLTITTELHERACQFVADLLLDLANSRGAGNARMMAAREEFGLPPNPAHAVEEAAAQIALYLSRQLASGKLRPPTA